MSNDERQAAQGVFDLHRAGQLPDGLGLHGSGMFVVNPPWTLRKDLAAAMPWLADRLAQDERAGWRMTSEGQ